MRYFSPTKVKHLIIQLDDKILYKTKTYVWHHMNHVACYTCLDNSAK